MPPGTLGAENEPGPMPRPTPFPLRVLAFLAAAALCAGLANAFARPDRKLTWTGWTPPATPVPAAPVPTVTPATEPPAPASQAPVPALAAPAVRPKPAAPRFPPDPNAVIREFSSQDAWDAYGLHLPFLDARRTSAFEEGHVAGAWPVPVWEDVCAARITEFEARAHPAPRDPIVIYCSGGGCEDSRLLAGKLVELGYRNLLIYADGFPDWEAKARPVAKGARP